MGTTTCQVVGFLLAALGLAGCMAATGMDMWSTQDLYDNPVTSVFQYEGLWRSCVRQSSGFTECRPYFTILGLPGICAIAGVSVFANMLVTNFWMSTANMYSGMGGMVQTVQTRYTFGSALFVGWVAGGLTLIGGVLMCIACRGLAPQETSYKAVSYHASGPNVGYKSAGYRGPSSVGPNSKPKKIYNAGDHTEDEVQSHPSKYDYV